MRKQIFLSSATIFPLHNIVAEEIIIGYILSHKIQKETLLNSIHPCFFSLKKYQILFFYIIKTYNEKKDSKLNLTDIIHQLWKKKILQDVGGINSIANIIQKSQSLYISENEYTKIKYFINILHYYYIKRLFIQYSNNIIQINYLYNLSIGKIYQTSVKYLYTISNIYQRYRIYPLYNNIKNFLYKIHQSQQENNYIFSGFKDLDKIINGFKSGDLIIVAGRPSMGKTSLAINIINNLSIKTNIPVHIFSLEMSKNEILDKLISLISNITVNKISTRSIKNKDWATIQKTCRAIMKSMISIDDNGQSSIDYIKSQCKNYKINKSIIIIDYLQLIKVNNQIDSRAQEIGTITRELKILAQNLKSTIIVLSQLNRNIENRANKRPLLSDLRESGCIDYSNLPKIQKNKRYKYIETIQCFKNFYILNRTKNLIFYENPQQYTFGIINYIAQILYTTHNHKLLTYNKWNKEDQIKYTQFHAIIQNNQLNITLDIELNLFLKVKRLIKNKVYDLTLKNYHNFTVNQYIIHNSIEQDADLILMLYKNHENLDNRIIDIIIAKHRHGPIGSFQLLFHADICKFSNIQERNLLDKLTT